MNYLAFSQKGLIRKNNEDNVLVGENGNGVVAVIADGCGGEKMGEVASKIACDYVYDKLLNFDLGSSKPSEYEEMLGKILQEANNRITLYAGENPECKGMATTLTCALLYKNVLYISHIGDSRAYMLHGSKLEKLTRDHTYYEQLCLRHEVNDDNRRELKKKYGSVLTKCLGENNFIKPDFYCYNVMFGDLILLSTDGLHSYIDPDVLRQILRNHADLNDTAESLANEVYNNGAGDNFSFVLIHNRP